jgi:hypothetical protein
MITRRLAVIVLMVAFGLAIVLFLPKSAAQPTGLLLTTDGKPALPAKVGGWVGTDMDITEKEINTLGVGTQFARKRYVSALQHRYLDTTIVLSGRDVANSLHRPERCLDGQGWQIVDSDTIAVPIKDQGAFDVQRLHVRKSVKAPDGQHWLTVNAYDYYWLIGEHTITASHFGRFFTDNRDRLFRGVDQRWAYVSMLVQIPSVADPVIQRKIDTAVDEDSRAFIQALSPSIHAPSVEYN